MTSNHRTLIETITGKITKQQDEELSAFEAMPITKLTDNAFVRIETVQDLHDGLLLFLGGANLAYEPVVGSLSGFGYPLNLNLVRRVSNAKHPVINVKRKEWVITVEDTPESITAAVVEMLTRKTREPSLLIDITGIPAGDRSAAITRALEGVGYLLTIRAERLLSMGDIADLMEWLAPLSPAMLDGQIAYGLPEWGPFLRREQVTHLPCHPVPSTDATRTLVAYARPDKDDIEKLFAWSVKTGTRIGLVNGARCLELAPWFKGMSADQSLLMGNRTLAPTLKLDLSSYADEKAIWEACRALGRASYRETLRPLNAALSASWGHQSSFLHLAGALATGANSWTLHEDRENHAIYGAYQQADELKLPRPQVVEGNDLLPTLPFGAMQTPAIVDELLAGWDGFQCASYQPVG